MINNILPKPTPDEFCDAAEMGDIELVKDLLARGADIDGQCCYVQTALMCASCFGHTFIAELLIERGAALDIQDDFGRTARWWAENRDRPDIAQMLKEAEEKAADLKAAHETIASRQRIINANAPKVAIKRSPPP